MLKNIDPRINARLLYTLARMGHGDELAIVDSNFPADSMARHCPEPQVLEIAADMPTAAALVLALMPLDSFVPTAATVMQVVDQPDAVPPALAALRPVIAAAGGAIGSVDRFAFYERARGAFAILRAQEWRIYGNVLLKKGIITDQ